MLEQQLTDRIKRLVDTDRLDEIMPTLDGLGEARQSDADIQACRIYFLITIEKFDEARRLILAFPGGRPRTVALLWALRSFEMDVASCRDFLRHIPEAMQADRSISDLAWDAAKFGTKRPRGAFGPPSVVAKIRNLAHRGRFGEAETTATSAPWSEEPEFRSAVLLARAAADEGNVAACIRYLEMAEARNIRLHRTLPLRTWVELKLGNFVKAEEAIAHYEDIFPKSYTAAVLRAQLNLVEGHGEAVVAYFSAAIRENPLSSYGVSSLYTAYMGQGRWGMVLQMLRAHARSLRAHHRDDKALLRRIELELMEASTQRK